MDGKQRGAGGGHGRQRQRLERWGQGGEQAVPRSKGQGRFLSQSLQGRVAQLTTVFSDF